MVLGLLPLLDLGHDTLVPDGHAHGVTAARVDAGKT
jgi:hypothetical protein